MKDGGITVSGSEAPFSQHVVPLLQIKLKCAELEAESLQMEVKVNSVTCKRCHNTDLAKKVKCW